LNAIYFEGVTMRIVSDFRDYYDCMQGACGYGAEPLFVRKKVDVEYKEWEYPFPAGVGFNNLSLPGFSASFYTIGFCGNIHYCLRIRKSCSDEILATAWNYEQLNEFVYKQRDEVKYVWTTNKTPYGKYRQPHCEQLKSVYRRLEESKGKTAKYFDRQLFPIFVGRVSNGSGTVTINDRLNKYGFASVMPPPQAFQELQMYLSNLAYPNKPVPEISNNDMIEAKGFDLKYSFRKEKKCRKN
jgi:hypothetical protein